MSLPKISAMPVKRRQTLVTVGVIGGVMLIVLAGLYLSDPNRKPHGDLRTAAQKSVKDVVRDFRTPGKAIDPSQVWMTRSEAQLQQMQEDDKNLRLELDQMKGQFNSLQGKSGSMFPPGIPPPPGEAINTPAPFPPIASATAANSSPAFPRNALPAPFGGAVPSNGLGTPGVQPTPPPPKIVDVSLLPTSVADAGKEEGKAKEATPTIEDSIPAGAFTSAVLLNGLDAPTGGLAKTNPIPMLMRLLNNGSLPNGFQSRVKACFVTGAGYGDLSAERAYVRLEKLSCVMRDGKIIDADVDGYIAGEDGKNGLRGTVISKQGALIARALFAGIAGGLGQAIATSYSQVQSSALGTVQTVNPSDVAQVGLATGVGKGLEKIADFYIARAQELYPVIEVDSNRRGDVVLSKRVVLGPVFAEAWQADE